MNAYDFDKTILKGNSVRNFCIFCLLRLPYLWPIVLELLLAVILRALRIIKKDTFLRMLELFVVFVPKRQWFVRRYWMRQQKHVRKWYLDVKRPDDLIISASPEYEISEICRILQVDYICTACSPKTGLVHGPHCYGQQKVVEFQRRFGDTTIENFYSDSMSDEPMFKLATNGYLVKGNKITLVYHNGQKVQ